MPEVLSWRLPLGALVGTLIGTVLVMFLAMTMLHDPAGQGPRPQNQDALAGIRELLSRRHKGGEIAGYWQASEADEEEEPESLPEAPPENPSLDPRFWKVVSNWRVNETKRRRLTHTTGQSQRTASVHFFYQPSSGATEGIGAWYNEVTITGRGNVSFFNVNGHAYGYSGIQSAEISPDGTMIKGKVLFSIWDQLCKGDDPDACPPDKSVKIMECCAVCDCYRFGGEGTGGKSSWDNHIWEINKPISILTTAEAMANNNVLYSGYIFDPAFTGAKAGPAFTGDTGAGPGWMKLGALRVNRGEPPKDWAIKSTYSFVEQWTGEDPAPLRWAKFGPVFTRRSHAPTDTWDPVYQARWFHGEGETEDMTHINSKVSAAGNQFEMGIAGDIKKEAALNQNWLLDKPETKCSPNLINFVAMEEADNRPTSAPPLAYGQERFYVECKASNGIKYKERNTCGNCSAGKACKKAYKTTGPAQCGKTWCGGKYCAWVPTPGGSATAGSCEFCSGNCSRRLDLPRNRPGNRRLKALAPGTKKIPPPSLPTVTCHGGGTGTTTPSPKGFKGTNRYAVIIKMTVANVNFASLDANAALKAAFLAAAKASIVAKTDASITQELVNVTMKAGSVIIEAKVIPPSSTTYMDLQVKLEAAATAMETDMTTKLQAVAGIAAVTSGTLSATGTTTKAQAIAVNMNADSKTFFFLLARATGQFSVPMLALSLCLLVVGHSRSAPPK